MYKYIHIYECINIYIEIICIYVYIHIYIWVAGGLAAWMDRELKIDR